MSKQILFVSRLGNGGNEYYLAEALTEYTEYHAIGVRFTNNYINYPYHILRPSHNDLVDLSRQSEIVGLIDYLEIPEWLGLGPRIVKIYTGTWYRSNHSQINEYDKTAGLPQFVVTLDLTQFGPKWLPLPMWDLSNIYNPPPEFIVTHAPTNRIVKGTGYVIQELQNKVALDIIENVDNCTCIERKARGRVYIDQFILGYGTNALEAWAMGMPVVAHAEAWVADILIREIDEMPYIDCEPVPGQLGTIVDNLYNDHTYYHLARKKGQIYLHQYHDPERVAKRFLEIL